MADRAYWLTVLERLARPVLGAAAAGKLKETMPVETAAGATREDRAKYTHLEAVARTLAGISPWLETGGRTGDEGNHRAEIADMAVKAVASIADPKSPDYVFAHTSGQPLVDSAFLVEAFLRAPNELFNKLDETTRKNLVTAFREVAKTRPPQMNWLLFSAMVEIGRKMLGDEFDQSKIDWAITQHEKWYKGDGVYGDGERFHFDYYNSFVIHPMILEVAETQPPAGEDPAKLRERMLKRAVRYAAIQERMISPEGAVPPVGRSLPYRCGIFHLLAMISLRKQLPEEIKPAQVRGAMTTMIRRFIEAPGTFDNAGWLTIGYCGHQPGMAEAYISTGSTYLAALALLPLGLPSDDPFWKDEPADWTSKRMYAGATDIKADHAVE